MSIPLTKDFIDAFDQLTKDPILALEIDGLGTTLSSGTLKKVVRIGDPEFIIGQTIIGGLVALQGQKSLMSLEGSSKSITQSINPDRGISQSISTMTLRFIDENQEISTLLKPDETQTPTYDVFGQKCKLWLGADNIAYKDDFIILHRGIIDEIKSGAGYVDITVALPDQKRNAEVFIKADTELTSGISAAATTAPVTSTTNFLQKITGPSGSIDSDLETYIRIDDEIIEYETTDATNFLTLTRGSLGSTATTHASGATVESLIRLNGNAIDLALKLMFSGKAGAYFERTATSIEFISASLTVENSIFFDARDVTLEDGVTVGDFVTTTGSSEGANNVTLQPITSIEVIRGVGSYIVVGGTADFAVESSPSTPVTVKIRSRYDVWPDGCSMDGEDVDVSEHERIRDTFLSSAGMDFLLLDSKKGKEFIETQLYNPVGAYGVPRKSQASVGMHTPPIPGSTVKEFNLSNVINPSSIVLRRTQAKNFYNGINTAYEKLRLEDRYLRLNSIVSGDSIDRIDTGVKALNIRSEGIRTTTGALTILSTVNNRRLKKYRFGAEFMTLKSMIKDGIDLEPGDIVIVNMSELKIVDILTGTREGESRLFQIDNKKTKIDGEIQFLLVDTGFDKDARYGLISHSSNIKSGISATEFIIEQTGNHPSIGVDEYKKWEQTPNAGVIVRSADWSTVSSNVKIDAINGNKITVDSSLGFTPSSGMVMEMSTYDEQNEDVKLRYVFMTDSATFSDGKSQYLMI